MADELEQFEDPNLKAVLRRAVGAPPRRPDLRARIAEMVEKETRSGSGGNGAAAGPLPMTLAARRLHPMRWLAAAAVLMIAVGSGWFLYEQHREAQEQAEYMQANSALLK